MTQPFVTILDDDPEVRHLLTDTLEEAGFATQSFSRARDFEAALKRATPDICLVDLSLPDTDGLALVHRLALEQGASVIIISGRAQVQDRVTGLELGADDYITKPFDPVEVVARIRARLRSRNLGGEGDGDGVGAGDEQVLDGHPQALEHVVAVERWFPVDGDGGDGVEAEAHQLDVLLRQQRRGSRVPEAQRADRGAKRGAQNTLLRGLLSGRHVGL